MVKRILKKLNKKHLLLLPLFLFLFLFHGFFLENTNSDQYLMSRSVKIFNSKGSCSGEQVRAPSGQDYILTAAHCRGLMDESFTFNIELENKQIIKRKFIAEDDHSDLMLLEGIPNMKGLPVAESIRKAQKIKTFTHGRGFDTYKTEGQLIMEKHLEIAIGAQPSGEPEEKLKCDKPKHKIYRDIPTFFGVFTFCVLSVDEVAMTAMIVPGSSGGMVLNMEGELIGVVSAGDGIFGYIVSLRDIHKFLAGY